MAFSLRLIGLIFLVSVILVLMGLGIRSIFTSSERDTVEEVSQVSGVTLHRTFQEALIEQAVKNGAVPTSGFDAETFLRAVPGLYPQDFNGVETQVGHYEYVDGELIFVSDTGEFVSKKDIHPHGYGTLLKNLSDRFGEPIVDYGSVLTILGYLESVPPPGAFTKEVLLNEDIEVGQYTLTPFAILEDSRCPFDAHCVQSGTVLVQVLIQTGLRKQIETLALGESLESFPLHIMLVAVSPRASREGYVSSDYRLTFRVEHVS